MKRPLIDRFRRRPPVEKVTVVPPIPGSPRVRDLGIRYEDVNLPDGAEMAFFTEDGRQVSEWWPVHAKVLPIPGQPAEKIKWLGIRHEDGAFDRFEPASFTYSEDHGRSFTISWRREIRKTLMDGYGWEQVGVKP